MLHKGRTGPQLLTLMSLKKLSLMGQKVGSRDVIFSMQVASLSIVEASIVIRWQRQMTVEPFWMVAARELEGETVGCR
jgi:hypothetical protein